MYMTLGEIFLYYFTFRRSLMAVAAVSLLASGAKVAAASAVKSSTSGSRTFTHWSEYVLIAGAIVAAVTAIATGILAIYAVTVVCGLLCASQIIGFYYIR